MIKLVTVKTWQDVFINSVNCDFVKACRATGRHPKMVNIFRNDQSKRSLVFKKIPTENDQ